MLHWIGETDTGRGNQMQDTQLGRISNFIWGVADDVLRDLYVRGKYRDVILPMTVLRRLDVVLEPTKEDVLRAQGDAGQRQYPRPGGSPETGGRPGVLQRLAIHAEKPAGHEQPAAAAGPTSRCTWTGSHRTSRTS